MFTLLKCIRQDTAWALFWVCVCVLYFNEKIFLKPEVLELNPGSTTCRLCGLKQLSLSETPISPL